MMGREYWSGRPCTNWPWGAKCVKRICARQERRVLESKEMIEYEESWNEYTTQMPSV